VTRFVNATAGAVVRGYAAVLNRADLRSGQRAEYLADRRAASVAGSEATARALDRLVLADVAYRALERTLRHDRDHDPAEAVRRTIGEIPARELERRLRVSRLRDSRTDSTHPPTYLRSKLVRARQVPTAAVVLGISEAAATDAELMRAARPALDELAHPAPA
jgi:Zn-dependent protease with chaperone function